MDLSKINQTQLKYSCGAGGAAVNLYTGRLLFEHHDISLGANGYKIGVSHIYNSQIELPSNINTCMGNGWKLDIQQYIFKDENNNYVYLDGAGYQHVFDLLQGDQYYDTTGLGLILTVNSSNKVITDEQGNQMKFEADRLISTTSCQNTHIVKNFNYDSNGKLISIYDGRKTGTQIAFDYDDDTGLLTTIKCKTNLVVKKVFNYYYDSSNNLLKITMYANSKTQNVALFSYIDREMTYAVSMEDKSALKFNYNQDKISSVGSGVANLSVIYSEDQQSIYCGDDLYCGDDIYCGETERKVLDYNISGGVETLDLDKISQNNFIYNSKNTIVTNDKIGDDNIVKMVYYFNEKGFTTSILEANKGDINDLRTLEKIPGKLMLSEGTDSESINTHKAYVWNTNNILSIVMSNDLKDYRKLKCTNYVNYTCSFLLKLNQKMDSSKVQITINSDSVNSGTIDNSAVNSWQFISIPVYIPDKDLNSITLEFEDKSAYKSVKIADMRLSYSSVSSFCVTYEQKYIPLNMITSVILDNEKHDIREEFYLSENDIQSTYLSLFKERVIKSQINNNFILSCCDKTKKIVVNSVKLCVLDQKLPLEFDNDLRSQWYHQIESPDKNLATYFKLDFLHNINIGNKTVDYCIRQITEANNGSVSSYMESYVDLTGKLLLEQDEYEVQTIYDYDEYGVLTSEIIQHKDTDEKITFTSNTTASDNRVTDYKSDVKTYNNDPFGYIDKIEYNGKDEDTSNKLTTTFGYNLLNDKITSVENDIGGKNIIQYNTNGSLFAVTPTGWTSNMYGYKFCYNTLGEPNKFYLTYNNGVQKAQDLLVEKIISHTNGTIITKQYRDKLNPDISTVTLDKYGRTNLVDEGGNITTFKRQDSTGTNGASDGTAEVTEMFDPYENRKYMYHYDDNNNITGYDIKNSDGTTFLSINASGEEQTTYKTDNYTISESDTVINYQQEKLLNPRINQTIDFNVGQTDYSYDFLGRIEAKKNELTGITENIHYKENTLSIDHIKITKNLTPVNREYYFDNTYDERGNIETNSIKSTNNLTDPYTKSSQYTYDKANRLKTEITNASGTISVDYKPTEYINNYIKTYTYNKDGSIDTEISNETSVKQYVYFKGRLHSYYYNFLPGFIFSFDYDNLGNCTKYNTANLEWERGNLLKNYTEENVTANYSYNNQGIRFKKKIGEKTTTYYLDGAKLLGESLNGDRGDIKYLYDADGIMGFKFSKTLSIYYYVKDAMGNVIAILDEYGEVALYEYDAWGNCTIIKDNNDGIGALNPIRWKSQYYDNESGLYYINGRYYSPFIKQYISALSPEIAMVRAGTINGLNMYLLTIDNPVNMGYNGNTIETNTKLTWDPPELSGWQYFWDVTWRNFWNSRTGKGVAIGLVVVASILCIFAPGFAGYLIAAEIGIGIDATISGLQSMINGNGFCKGLESFITEDWEASVAINMFLALVTYGIGKAVQAVANAGSKEELANAIGQQCFVAGTLIKSADGDKPIENIKVGDYVYSENPETGEKGLRKVLKTFVHETNEIVHIQVDSKKITTTPEHPFYVPGKGWVVAGDLKPGNKLLLLSGKIAIINSVQKEILNSPVKVYNFEVEDFHTYFVSDFGVLVHNTCAGKGVSNVDVDPRKFSEYIFKEGADHGKDHVFRSLGYGIENTDDLVKIYKNQAAINFKNGKYTLGKLDKYGQRIDIEIALNGIGNATGKTSYLKSGWLMLDDGSIRLATPFSGFTR